MGSYKQWAASFAKNGPARVTWVCGRERVLVSEVVDSVVRGVSPDYVEVYAAGRDREPDIWEAALSSLSVQTRVVIVRNVAALKAWGHLHAWLRERPRHIYLVFDDDREDFPRDDGQLGVPLTWLRDTTLGQLVRCSALDPVDAVAWAQRQLPGLEDWQARRLLERASGSLSEVRTVLAKARMLGGINDAAIDMLCSELPGDFADRLILGDRRGAMLAADSMGQDGLGFSLGLLASRLETLGTLHRAARDNVSRRDVTAKLGVPAFLAQKYAGVAKDYGEERVARCWVTLVAVEDAYRSGKATGAAEVLVVSWLGST
jgi:hypothetical protein